MLEERFARWEEEYRERYIAEGVAKGRAENMNEVLEKGMRKILQYRFGEISEYASNLIAKVKDPIVLDKFMQYACMAKSPQEFVEMIHADMNLS